MSSTTEGKKKIMSSTTEGKKKRKKEHTGSRHKISAFERSRGNHIPREREMTIRYERMRNKIKGICSLSDCM